MQNSNLSITELVVHTGSEMHKWGYSTATIARYEKVWRMLIAYAQRNGTDRYSTEFAYKFLREKFGSLERFPSTYTEAEYLRGVCRLEQFFSNGIISSKRPLRKKYDYPSEYRDVIKSYMKRKVADGLSYSRNSSFALYLERFAKYLIELGVKDFKHLSSGHIRRFIEDGANLYTASTVSATICCLRGFFAYIHEIGETESNLGVFLPSVRYVAEDPIPSAFSREEVEKILDCVDRCYPKGKRDYAMLMLAARLGIRSSDICSMVFQNLKWEENKIDFTQQKTGKQITLPLLNDVGDAIIDYLKVRPQSCSKHVFLRMGPPYLRLNSGSLYQITRTYMRRSGIHIPPGKKHGPHSLRHSLSSMLLESNVPLPVISGILSHSSSDTTKIYLKINIRQLKECALDVSAIDSGGSDDI
jgi:site-specific recombinase XerD